LHGVISNIGAGLPVKLGAGWKPFGNQAEAADMMFQLAQYYQTDVHDFDADTVTGKNGDPQFVGRYHLILYAGWGLYFMEWRPAKNV
jgi:hypothetical protein